MRLNDNGRLFQLYDRRYEGYLGYAFYSLLPAYANVIIPDIATSIVCPAYFLSTRVPLQSVRCLHLFTVDVSSSTNSPNVLTICSRGCRRVPPIAGRLSTASSELPLLHTARIMSRWFRGRRYCHGDSAKSVL